MNEICFQILSTEIEDRFNYFWSKHFFYLLFSRMIRQLYNA